MATLSIPNARNTYGALTGTHACPAVAQLIKSGIEAASLGGPFFESNPNGSIESLNYDTYDVLVDDGDVRAVIVQRRSFYRRSAYRRPKMGRAYYLIVSADADGTHCTVKELPDPAVVNRRAKAAEGLGDVVRHYLGTKTMRTSCPRLAWQWTVCWKVVRRRSDGVLVSVYDGSEWPVGRLRSQAVAEDHGGGFYCYRSAKEAVSRTREGLTFGADTAADPDLVLVECAVSGRSVEYDSGKVAWSRMRIVREVGEV